MANKRRYLSLWKDDNEWLASPPPTDPQELGEWHIAWAKLRKDCDWQIEITDCIYTNQEHGETPEWIDVTIFDEGVLPFKMGKGVAESIEGISHVGFRQFFKIDLPPKWRLSYSVLEVYKDSGVNLRMPMDDGYEEIEVSITEQFNQAIGEGE